MRLRTQVACLIFLLLSGCTAVPSTVAEPAAPEVPVPPPPAAEVRLAFVGDILLGGGLAGTIAYHGPDYPWKHAAPILRKADLAFGNLETSVTTGGTPVPDKQFTFRSRPETLRGAGNAGMDVLTLANNHAMDYGPEALIESIRHVRAAGIHPAGAGRNADDAYRPLIVEMKGLKIATLAFTRVIPTGDWAAGPEHIGLAAGYDPEPVLAAIDAVRPEVDVVIVLFHWGEELAAQPRPTDVDLAGEMIGHGATVVVGHHPHVLQGINRHDSNLIAYSLGNFIFTQGSRQETRDTGILEVTVNRSGVTEAHFTPMVIAGGQPRPAGAAESERILDRLARLSQPWKTRVASDGSISNP